MRTVYIAPGSFAYLYDECLCCFWLKLRGHKLESAPPLPRIFNDIDRMMKEKTTSDTLRDLGIPAKKIIKHGLRVLSEPFVHEGISLVIRGEMDFMAELDGDTYAVGDYKTTNPNPQAVRKFSRQLHAYEYALRFPSSGGPTAVESLHLICLDGTSATMAVDGVHATITAPLVHLPVELDRRKFEKLLELICLMVSLDTPPKPGDYCERCAERAALTRTVEAA